MRISVQALPESRAGSTLRHTAATKMLEGGSPLLVVASILGWSPELLKAGLTLEIDRILKARKLTQTQAGKHSAAARL